MSKFSRPAAGKAAPASKTSAPAAKSAPASRYKKSAQVQVSQDGNYQRPGRYLFFVQRVEEGSTRNREDFVSVRSVVIAADGSERTPLEVKFGGAVHRVGEETSWFQKLSGEYFDQNMLKFAIAASNTTQEEIVALETESDTTIVDEMVSDEQPFAGIVMEAHVQTRIKKVGKELMKDGLPEDQLKAEHVTTVTNWIRKVPFAELPEMFAEEPEVLAKFIPDLDEKIAKEAAEG